jgi:hypothetical protein
VSYVKRGNGKIARETNEEVDLAASDDGVLTVRTEEQSRGDGADWRVRDGAGAV